MRVIKELFIKGKNKIDRFAMFLENGYNKQTMITYVTLSIVLNLIIEMLGRKSPIKGIYHMVRQPYVFLVNTLILLMVFSITLMFRRRYFLIAVMLVAWLGFGISNCILLNFRVTPFSYTDLLLIDSAMDIMNKYMNFAGEVLLVVLVIVAIVFLIICWFKMPKLNHRINYIRNGLLVALIVLVTSTSLKLAIDAKVLALNFGNLADAYKDYGFVYCFSNSVVNRGIRKPSGYSEKKVLEIKKNMDEKVDVKKAAFTPNIVFVQLESFFDISRAKNIKLNKDPIPIYNSLRKRYTSGYVTVPVVGAGTVNTEFESITGMNLDDFGPGEYPYKTILTETTCDSICYSLKDYGYKTHTIHNNTGTFYGRNEVLPNLGFDTFTSVEFMDVDEWTPIDWPKDKFLTEEIINTLKVTPDNPDYIYTISVQAHGKYPTSGEYPTDYTVTGADEDHEISEEHANELAYYSQQIHEDDEFVGELIEALSAFDEDVILVMYGDHLPSLGFDDDDFEGCNKMQTEYVIWTNFNALSKNINYKSEDLELYQMSSKILEQLHISDGAINEYHQTCKNNEDYLDGLKTLEYDILYGDKLCYDGVNPYERTDMKMGIRDIYITGVHKIEDGYLEVNGHNFTKYSKVYKEDEVMKTEFVDSSTLRVYDPDVEMLDKFYVSQQNSNTHVLFTTKAYLYIGK
ncbi:MAG TPA: arylsulfatase [Eubacterium sp.]|nr:arylsulfatase [Eubacterium sp.]